MINKFGKAVGRFFQPIVEMVLSSMKKSGEYDSKKINRFMIVVTVLFLSVMYGANHNWNYDIELILVLLGYAGYESNQLTREKISLNKNNNENEKPIS